MNENQTLQAQLEEIRQQRDAMAAEWEVLAAASGLGDAPSDREIESLLGELPAAEREALRRYHAETLALREELATPAPPSPSPGHGNAPIPKSFLRG